MTKIGFALTSSFCSVDKVLGPMQELVRAGFDVIPIVSPFVLENDTRFGKGNEFKKQIEFITGREIVTTVIEAEKFGPTEPLDLLVIAPATGNFIAKLANGISDNVVTMSAKATLRNQKPIVISIATNDGLGLNGSNIMRLLNQKGVFFVPFGQDNYSNKPNSLVSHYDLIIPTIEAALNNEQYQPVLKDYQKTKKK